MAAITILQALDAGMREGVDPDDPVASFRPGAFLIENGKVDRRIWEISWPWRFATRSGPATCSWRKAATMSRSGT